MEGVGVTAPGANGAQPLVEVRGLQMHFPITGGMLLGRKIGEVKAVDGVDFSIQPRRDLGAGRRKRLRQDHDRPLHPAPRKADRRRNPL